MRLNFPQSFVILFFHGMNTLTALQLLLTVSEEWLKDWMLCLDLVQAFLIRPRNSDARILVHVTVNIDSLL